MLTNMMRMKEASKYTGVSAQTLRKLIDQGKLRATRIGTRGDRYIDKTELDKFIGRQPQHTGCAIYTRVSTRKPDAAGNLTRQQARLQQYCETNHLPIISIIEDTASGINENRRGLQKLIKLAQRGAIDTIVVESRDRLARFGFTYLEQLFQSFGVQIRVVKSEEKNHQEELVEDLIAILTSFSARIHGKRGGRKTKKLTTLVRKELSA